MYHLRTWSGDTTPRQVMTCILARWFGEGGRNYFGTHIIAAIEADNCMCEIRVTTPSPIRSNPPPPLHNNPSSGVPLILYHFQPFFKSEWMYIFSLLTSYYFFLLLHFFLASLPTSYLYCTASFFCFNYETFFFEPPFLPSLWFSPVVVDVFLPYGL